MNPSRTALRLVLPALLLALVATLVPMVATTASAQGTGYAVERFEAADGSTMSTSVARRFWGDANTVVIARADDYADALAAAPVAGLLGAPLLLTNRDSLPRLISEQIEHYKPTKVIVMGGTGAVSANVVDELKRWGAGDIERIAGSNRFETAVRAMEFVRVRGATADPFVVRGEGPNGSGWEDAVAVSQHAANIGAPILLTRQTSLPAETAAALDADNPRTITVVGGPAAVSYEASGPLSEYGTVSRLEGDSRYNTSIAVADAALARGADDQILWLTSGGNWQDAMVAGVAAATRGGVLLFVNNFRWDDSTGRSWVLDHLGPVDQINVIGDRSGLTTEIDLELMDRAHPTAPWSPPAGVRITPGDNAQAIVDAHPDGTTFVFTAGLHRGVSIKARDGDRFTGEEGALLSGAMDLDLAAVHPENGRFMIPGISYTPPAPTDDVRMEDGRDAEILQTSLYRNSRRMTHVADGAAVDQPHEWHLDTANQRIIVLNDPRNATWQLTVTQRAIYGEADNVEVDHLTFERYATPAKVGAVDAHVGRNWHIHHITVHQSHSAGVRTGYGATVTDSRFTHNGQVGITGGDHLFDGTQAPVRIERNQFAYNGEVGYRGSWEVGGAKMTNTIDTVFLQNWAHNNRGSGIWCDLDCKDPLYKSNLAEHNTRAGLHIEETVGAMAEFNISRANGASQAGNLGVGIWVANSPGVELQWNILESNRLPINAQHNGIPAGEHGNLEIADLFVHDNDIRVDAFLPGVRVETGENSRYDRDDLRWANNTYRLRQDETQHFWMGRKLTVSQWQDEFNYDRSGTFRNVEATPFTQPNPYAPQAYGATPIG